MPRATRRASTVSRSRWMSRTRKATANPHVAPWTGMWTKYGDPAVEREGLVSVTLTRSGCENGEPMRHQRRRIEATLAVRRKTGRIQSASDGPIGRWDPDRSSRSDHLVSSLLGHAVADAEAQGADSKTIPRCTRLKMRLRCVDHGFAEFGQHAVLDTLVLQHLLGEPPSPRQR